MIRYDYPNIHRWLRELYYEVDEESKGAFKSTTHFEIVSQAAILVKTELTFLVHGGICYFGEENDTYSLGTCCSNHAPRRMNRRVERSQNKE